MGAYPPLGNSMDLPFEENPAPMPMPDHTGFISGGVAVMAAVVPIPDIGPRPALVFRFATPTGDFYPPMVLITDDDQLANLGPLVTSAITAAVKAAEGAR